MDKARTGDLPFVFEPGFCFERYSHQPCSFTLRVCVTPVSLVQLCRLYPRCPDVLCVPRSEVHQRRGSLLPRLFQCKSSTLTFFLVCLADTFCPFRASQLLCPGILHWSTLKTTSQPPFQRYFESHPYISPKTDFKLQPLTAGALEAFSGDERRRLRAGKHGLCAASSLGACSRLSASCCEMHHAEIYGHVPQVGLLYDKTALAEATALVSDWTTEERAFLRAQVREPLPIYLDLASVFDGFPLPSTGSKACP